MGNLVAGNNQAVNQSSVSNNDYVKLYFEIHEKLNTKNEQIDRDVTSNLVIDFNDINELHCKILQTIKSIIGTSTTTSLRINVSQLGGLTERFNSFEAFEKSNMTSSHPTQEVAILYSFTCSPDGKLFENYKLSIVLKSRIVQIKQLQDEAPAFMRGSIFFNLVSTTAKISIQYGDYIKAKSFLSTFDEWVNGRTVNKKPRFVELIQKKSHLIPKIGTMFILLLLSYFTARSIDPNEVHIGQAAQFIVLYAFCFLFSLSFSNLILRKVEESIDKYNSLSYISLNLGDKKIIAEFEKGNKGTVTSVLLNLFFVMLIGLSTNAVYDLIKFTIAKF